MHLKTLIEPLYVILDASLAADPMSMAVRLARSGVRLVQLRDKAASARRVFEVGQQVVAQAGPLGVRVIVNDRADIAGMIGAGGVHVGQEDLPIEAARAICGPDMWVGVSTHSLEQVRAAAASSADYVAVGPAFATSTKANPDPVVGIELIRQARKLTRKPLVAIGGITVESAADVYGAGADSLAVARDVLLAREPEARAREYLEIADRLRRDGAARGNSL